MPCYYHVPHYCGIYYFPQAPPPTIINVYTNVTPSWLPRVSLSTASKLYDTSSRTVLTQTFVNPSKSTAVGNAKYNFPLYENCAVVAFCCFVGKRLIKGIVKEKDEAKTDYNEAVARGETAALLEQHAPDVFRTSLGNIPAGETVKVEVEYIMELKHDAEVDGVRFTIPTSIAPRYGEAPSGLPTYSDGQPIPGTLAKGGMKISVKITMPSNIRAVQSPSHPISMHLGGHIENVSDDAFNPKHALATLSQTSAELGADFVLLFKCADLSSPRALLETHPTLPNSRALMVTLVPKFTLPPGPKPEIVFVVDRSGSMGSRMEPLKSALGVFLKSLPVGVKFNICSFGSSHSFLWTKSQPYSANTLEQAQKHVQIMSANLGGTEILPPVMSTVSRRYKDLPLEIMVLTDGEVWNTEQLFEYIKKETASGDVRLFSLGIGRDVSHGLVEGMARVGRGFAQIVSDEKEGLEGKVVRMLRGGLSAHIKDYRLEWDGRPTEEQVQASAKGKSTLWYAVEGVKKNISLFDTQADTHAPISGKKGTDRFSHLPEFTVPTVLQTPYKIPPLFPFSRSTVYAILSGDVTSPSSVWLRGTTISGNELELEIAVQILPDNEQTIHQLAARKLLQELEEGTGYLHSGNYGVDKENNAGTFGDWVEREGIRLGVQYGLASKWTSFVAVRKENEKHNSDAGVDGNEDWTEIESVTEAGDMKDNVESTFGDSWSSLFSSGTTLRGRDSSLMAPMGFSGVNPTSFIPPSPYAIFGSPSTPATFSRGYAPAFQPTLDAPTKPASGAQFGNLLQSSSPPGQQSTSTTSPFCHPQQTSPLVLSTSIFGQPQSSFGQVSRCHSYFIKPATGAFGALTGGSALGATLSAPPLPGAAVSDKPTFGAFGSSSPARPLFSVAASNQPTFGTFGSTASGAAVGSPSPVPFLFGAAASNQPTFGTFGSTASGAAVGSPSPAPFLFGAAASNQPTSGIFSPAVGGAAFGVSSPGQSLFGAASSNHSAFGNTSGTSGDGNGIGGNFSLFAGQHHSTQTAEGRTMQSEHHHSASGSSAPLMTTNDIQAMCCLLRGHRAEALIALQTFEGSFPLTIVFALILGTTLIKLELKLVEFVPAAGDSLLKMEKERLWATVLAVYMFEAKLTDAKDMWELVVEKAKGWIVGLAIVGNEDLDRLEVLAREVLV